MICLKFFTIAKISLYLYYYSTFSPVLEKPSIVEKIRMKEAILWHVAFWSTVIGAKLAGMPLEDKAGWACAVILYIAVLIIAIARESRQSSDFIQLEKEKMANELELAKVQAEILGQANEGLGEPEEDLHVVGFGHTLSNEYPSDVIIPPDATP